MRAFIVLVLCSCILFTAFASRTEEILSELKSFTPKQKALFLRTLIAVSRSHDDEAADFEDSEEADTEQSSFCTTAALNVRSGACTSFSILKTLPMGTQVTKVGGPQSGCGYQWAKISASSVTGWVANQFLGSCGGGSTAGQRVSQWAKQQVGKCYSQDVNLRRGPKCFDCSGLVNKGWELQGKQVPWTTHGYPSATNMIRVSASQVAPGDILYRFVTID